MRKRKFRSHGPKTRSTGLAKMTPQGTVQAEKRTGRQKKRWENDIIIRVDRIRVG